MPGAPVLPGIPTVPGIVPRVPNPDYSCNRAAPITIRPAGPSVELTAAACLKVDNSLAGEFFSER